MKRGFWAIIGQTFKRLIGVVFAGLGLMVVYGSIFGEPVSETGEASTLTERVLILTIGLVFYAVGACIIVYPETVGDVHVFGVRVGKRRKNDD